MYTENERLVCLKLRNYTRIWNAYSEIGWLIQPNYETTREFRTCILKMKGWWGSNYETTPGFGTHIVDLDGCSSQTTKLRQDLKRIKWKWKVGLSKLRNYTRIWNTYTQIEWLLQPNYETTAGFRMSVLKILRWSSSNYETTPGFETYIVKMEGWSGKLRNYRRI